MKDHQQQKVDCKLLYVLITICLGLVAIASVGDHFWGNDVDEQLDRLEKQVDQMEQRVERLQNKLQKKAE